jgi:hypothetical protein
MAAYQKLPPNARNAKHGYGKTPTYSSWVNMRTRCENPKATQWKWYGARGVTVCERWKTFGLFLEDMGERPSKKHTLDRIDGAKGYEPGNVQWSLQTEQCRNRRSTRSVLRGDGILYRSMAEAAEDINGTIGGIWTVCNGGAKRHRGYGWSYA